MSWCFKQIGCATFLRDWSPQEIKLSDAENAFSLCRMFPQHVGHRVQSCFLDHLQETEKYHWCEAHSRCSREFKDEISRMMCIGTLLNYPTGKNWPDILLNLYLIEQVSTLTSLGIFAILQCICLIGVWLWRGRGKIPFNIELNSLWSWEWANYSCRYELGVRHVIVVELWFHIKCFLVHCYYTDL